MVIFDQFPATSLLDRDGRIDAGRYPNLAALAKRSYWFENTAATSDMTEFAVPAILSGRRPHPSDLPLLQDYPRNVFTLLGGSHALHATEATTHLCPDELCETRSPGFAGRMRSLASDASVVAGHAILPADLRGGLPAVEGKWGDFAGAAAAGEDPTPLERLAAATQALRHRRERFLGFVDAIGRGGDDRPGFHFLHSMVPHYDFEYVPSGHRYGRPEFLPGLEEGLRWGDNRELVARGYQRHLLQVGFVDRLVGRLVRRLRATGLYDRALVVLTADHGATFRPGLPLLGRDGRDPLDLLPVPLIVKAPGQQRGRTVSAHVQTVDILPTMAQLLRVRIPWEVDGRSALAPGADRRTGLLHHPDEQPWRFSFRAFEAGRRVALRHKLAVFGDGTGRRGLYRIGPRQELLGRAVGDFPAARPHGLGVALDHPELLDDVAPRSGFLPVHVSGAMAGPGKSSQHDVAIALNGRIAAVARTATVAGSDTSHFSVVVPRARLHRGTNHVRVLEIVPVRGGVGLAPVASLTRG
jgi:hypothetical protein